MSDYMTRRRSRNAGLMDWLRSRITAMFEYDTRFWRIVSIGISCCTAVVTGSLALGIPSGYGIWFDVFTLILTGSLAMGIVSMAASLILSLAHVPVPRFLTGCCLYLTGFIWILTDFSDLDWLNGLGVALAVTVASFICSVAGAFLASHRFSRRLKNAVPERVLTKESGRLPY